MTQARDFLGYLIEPPEHGAPDPTSLYLAAVVVALGGPLPETKPEEVAA